jgi:tellurite resistance protein TerC
MLHVSLLAWVATIGAIAALFALDLFVSRPGHAHMVGVREAVLASVFYVAVAIAFGVAFGAIAGWDHGTEYFAGYIVEKSLSVDNLFVFVVIMTTFAVPAEFQQRVLTFGIPAALIMRAIFIAVGAALIATFSFMFAVFGVLLVLTAIQLFRHRDQDPDVEDNAIVRVARRAIPFTDDYAGGRMLTHSDGRSVPTPLFLVFLAIASSDLLFALDSIPARLRRHRGGLHRLRGQRVRAAGPASALLPRDRTPRPPRIPLDGAIADPRLHRRQAAPALRAPAGRLDPGG